MAWYDFIDIGTPPVFNPKVTPDPVDAERLEEKFQHAFRKFKPLYAQHAVSAPPSLMETVSKRTG